MKNTNDGVYQVVIDPDDEDVEALLAAANKAVDEAGRDVEISGWQAVLIGIAERLHPLIHYYVPMKMWDHGSQRAISTPYITCLWCPKTKEA